MQEIKKNLVRKWKGVMFPCDLIGENGRQLTNGKGIVEECSILLWKRGTVETKTPFEGIKKCGTKLFNGWELTLVCKQQIFRIIMNGNGW